MSLSNSPPFIPSPFISPYLHPFIHPPPSHLLLLPTSPVQACPLVILGTNHPTSPVGGAQLLNPLFFLSPPPPPPTIPLTPSPPMSGHTRCQRACVCDCVCACVCVHCSTEYNDARFPYTMLASATPLCKSKGYVHVPALDIHCGSPPSVLCALPTPPTSTPQQWAE